MYKYWKFNINNLKYILIYYNCIYNNIYLLKKKHSSITRNLLLLKLYDKNININK